MASANSQLGVAIFVILRLLLPTVCLNSQGHFDEHVAVFVFGDSLFDPGNNNFINTTTDFQANFWPYGESYFNPPSGRFSNGRLIPDFIAEYAKMPLIPAYFDPRNKEFPFGANFASGGAGALVESHAGFVVDLLTQLRHFGNLEKKYRQKLGDAKAEKLLSEAVYLFSCGGNDYLSPEGTNDSIFYPYTHKEYVELVTGNFTDVIKAVYEKGGRKFGTLTVAPLGCWPSIRAEEPGNTCNEEIGAISSRHNRALIKKLKKLAEQLDGFTYALYDLYASTKKMMKKPSKYGFKTGDTACCGSGPFRGIYSCGGMRGIKKYELCDDPSEYFFFDSNHPSESASRHFAELFWDGGSDVTGPYNLKELFEGTPPTTLDQNEEEL